MCAGERLTTWFATSIAIDPQSPETLYAGTDGGLFKSTSGGLSWSELKRNNDARRSSSGNE